MLSTIRPTTAPGLGNLTSQGVNAIRLRAAQQAGNLRASLGRRGLLGASFADSQLAAVEREYEDIERTFRVEAFEKEFENALQVINAEAASYESQAAQELAELGLTTEFLSNVNQAQVGQKQAAAFLAQQQVLAGLDPQQAAEGEGKPGPTGGKPAPAPRPRPIRSALQGGRGLMGTRLSGRGSPNA